MKGKIAVVLNQDSQVSSLEKETVLAVFKMDNGWKIAQEIPVSVDNGQNIAAVRQQFIDLAAQLEDCKIIAGSSITGIAYHTFDRLGYSIFEVQELSPAVLDSILEDVSNASEKNRTEKAVRTEPAETETPGVYSLDLLALQKEHPEITSKKALQPFLRTTPFVELHLQCAHVPPWIENDPCLSVRTQGSNGSIHVVITKQCGV